jgi:Family of unknown function (DUF6526)
MNQQTFANHGKIVPAFHFFVMPVLVANVLVRCYSFFEWFPATPFATLAGVFSVLVSIALLVLAFLARIFALGVQDRVIRLEERLRYERLLPDDLKPRIEEFTIDQLVALRFACDAELPVLARKVLDAKINERKAIKQMVQNWRPDYERV